MAKSLLFAPDTNWYLWRTVYTLNTSRPMEDVLPYKLAEMIVKDAMLVRATHLMCPFDGPKNFRKDLYPEYKANRDNKVGNGDEYGDNEEGENLKAKVYGCLPVIFERFIEWGIPFYQPRKREGDDVLCSIAYAHHDTMELRFGAQDKDAYQYLLWPSVKLVDTSSKTKNGPPARIIDGPKAEKKKGVKIRQMVDYQTLIGDSGDNIKQIEGFGPAKAKAILKKYGTIRKWIDSGDDAAFIAVHKEHMRLNRKLVKLTEDALPPGSIDTWKLAKVKSKDKYLSRNYHELHELQHPKRRSLFG